MAGVVESVLETSLETFNKIVKKPEKLLNVENNVFQKVNVLTKVMYDLTKISETEEDSNTLKELIVDNFDEEQIWAQVEMQNKAKFSAFQKAFGMLNIGKLNQSPSLLLGLPNNKRKLSELENEPSEDQNLDFLTEENDDKIETSDIELDGEDEGSDEDIEDGEDEKEDEDEDDEDILNDPDFQHMSDSEGDDLPLFADLSEDEKSSGDDEDGGTFKEMEKEKKGGAARKTEVDDKFFKLSDMENFLEIEDKKFEKEQNKKEGDENDSEDEDNMDLFDGEEEEEDGGVMYGDYFTNEVPRDPKEEMAKEEAADDYLQKMMKKMRKTNGPKDSTQEDSDEMNLDDHEEESDEETGDKEESDDDQKETINMGGKVHKKNLLGSDSESDTEEKEVKSSHELKEERLQKKISRLEEVAIGEKPWQMTGEVDAAARDINSLLGEHLDHDTMAKNAPIMTDEVAKKLEDIILQRVKDKAWDDVERKVKPTEDPLEYKKRLVLDQEKSKMSLAQIYEQEYLALAEKEEKAPVVGVLDKENEETSKEVDQIRSDMRSLFSKLDSLSHLHYTPKQKTAEVKIVRNIPSITVEEVAPVAASNVALLAPAEIVEKEKGELKEGEDRDKTDKNRERRDKKAKKRAVRKERENREKLIDKINPGMGNKYSKQRALREVEEAEKQGKLSTIKDKGDVRSMKSSTSFFSQLQEEVKTHVKEKRVKNKKKKDDKNVNIASLKL